jgi:hypothetical protein
MAISLDDLKRLAAGMKLTYFVHPDQPMLMSWFTGKNGHYQFIAGLEDDGQYLKFRTLGFLQCVAEHVHAAAVLRVIGTINYQTRFIKVGWSRSDGEIMVYGDAWIADGTVTQGQFDHMLGIFVQQLDRCRGWIARTMETGDESGADAPDTSSI